MIHFHTDRLDTQQAKSDEPGLEESKVVEGHLLLPGDAFNDLLHLVQLEQRDNESLRKTMQYVRNLEQERIKLEHSISGKGFKLKPLSEKETAQYRKNWDDIGVIIQIYQRIYCDYYIDRYTP